MKLFICLALIFAVLASASRVLKSASEETRRNPFWKPDGKFIPATKQIELTFAVKQRNFQMLDHMLLQISSPKSPKYGQQLTLEQVNRLSSPTNESIEKVVNFLKSHDINKYEYSSGFIRVTVPVSVANKILDTNYHSYTNSRTGQTVLRVDRYSLPSEVASVLDFVAPTTNFPFSALPTPRLSARDRAVQAYQNTPDSLRELYAVGAVQGHNNHTARQTVTAFLNQYYEERDLQNFYKTYYPLLYGTPISNVVGPNGNLGGIEASLDVDYMTTLGSGVPTEFWSFAGEQPDNPENEPFLDWLYYLGNQTDIPYVFSTSYGEDEVSVDYDYADRMNFEFMKNGLRGVTFLFASGDSGVGSAFGACTTYTPQYPSDSPYVTAVGGTTNLNPEIGVGLSSGGFSNRWEQPSWQTEAVTNYLKTNTQLPNANLYNASGRGFPDIAAQATNFAVVCDGATFPAVAGTSCASPTAGGIFGLVNDARIAAGKSPMGFLNPFIYENPELFTDILSGNNPGCGTNGFYASSGWDPVTGWGTLNYTKIVTAALALP